MFLLSSVYFRLRLFGRSSIGFAVAAASDEGVNQVGDPLGGQRGVDAGGDASKSSIPTFIDISCHIKRASKTDSVLYNTFFVFVVFENFGSSFE